MTPRTDQFERHIDNVAWRIHARGPVGSEQTLSDLLSKQSALARELETDLREARDIVAHLVRLLQPLEQDGGLNVPGLATLNRERAFLARMEAKDK